MAKSQTHRKGQALQIIVSRNGGIAVMHHSTIPTGAGMFITPQVPKISITNRVNQPAIKTTAIIGKSGHG